MVAAVGCALVWLALLAGYDCVQGRLPNALTLPGALVVLAVAALTGRGGEAVLGAVALTAPYLAVHVLSPAAMGAGDVKLALGVGALTAAVGLDAWALAAVAAPVLTALVGLLVLRTRRTVPHGPSMCVATAVAVALTAG